MRLHARDAIRVRGPGLRELAEDWNREHRKPLARAACVRAHLPRSTRLRGALCLRCKRTRSSRSEAVRASRAHRPPHLVARRRGGAASGTAPIRAAAAAEARPEESAPRVLLVDDERSIRTICRVNLEGDGLAVAEAADGAEALEVVRRVRPSVVLLDVMMPGVDGWEVAEQLAADDATRDIPVVFLSARAAREDRLRAQELGAVGYVVKPFDPLELAGVVRDVLERVRER